MTQISKYPLDSDIESELFRKFWHALSSLRDADAVASFFSDFLSDTERLMLAKRFAIAVLLLRGKNQKEITKMLHVSFSGTGSVANWLKNAKPKTRAAIERIIAESNWEELSDKIEALFDKLPPRYGIDWSKAGKEKWQRTKKRAARQVFR